MSNQHPLSSAQLLGHLIGFDTTSCNSNFALIEFAEAFLREQGEKGAALADRLEGER